MRVLDLRGQECPKPVLRALRALATTAEKLLVILVDSRSCAETIKYMVESLAIGAADYREEAPGVYRVTVFRA